MAIDATCSFPSSATPLLPRRRTWANNTNQTWQPQHSPQWTNPQLKGNPKGGKSYKHLPIDLSTQVTGSNGAARFQQLSQSLRNAVNIVHLSFFDGIGAASLALRQLGVSPILTLTDPECIHIFDEHFGPKHMGDIQSFDIHKVVDTIVSVTDSSKAIRILVTAGPPCPVSWLSADWDAIDAQLVQHTPWSCQWFVDH